MSITKDKAQLQVQPEVKVAKRPLKRSLLDVALTAVAPLTGRSLRWIDRMPDAERVQLEELQAAYLAGKLDSAWTPRAILREVIEPAGIVIPVSFETFRQWFSGNK